MEFCENMIIQGENGSDSQLNWTIQDGSKGEPGAPFVILFIFGGLAYGLALQTIIEQDWMPFRVPYTVTLLISGIMFVIVIETVTQGTEGADRFYETFTLANTKPELVMYIFLPVLIFDSSFRMEAHGVFKAFWQIIIMATIGLCISTTIVAGAMYAFLHEVKQNKEWTFQVCLLLGSILSATDPVAVVALLQEMDAPKKIVILTEGESLFNDGTAIIAYEILLIVSRRSLQKPLVLNEMEEIAAKKIGIQILGIVVAPLIGLLSGRFCEILLRRTFNNEIREKGIILIIVYGTFFLCEQLHISGVLALAILGIWLSYKKHSISPESTEDNSRFWDFFNNWANTLVFILVGMNVSVPIVRSSIHFKIDVQEYGYIFVIYILINVSRYISICSLFPILKNTGYGLVMKDVAVLTWGGLRGAIPLLLALKLREEEPIRSCYSYRIGQKMLFYVAGAVTLTLLINATTFRPVLKLLKLDRIPAHKARLMKSIVKHLNEAQVKAIRELKQDRFLAEARWDLVDRLSRLSDPYEARTVEASSMKVSSMEEVSQEQVRHRLLQVQKFSYWRQYKQGLLSFSAINFLSDVVEEAIEKQGEFLDVSVLSKRWAISKAFAKCQRIVLCLNQYIEKRKEALKTIKPKSSSCLHRIYQIVYGKTYGLVIYFLVVLDSALAILVFQKTIQLSRGLRICLLCMYALLLADIFCKLLCLGKHCMKLHRNQFEIIFAVLYVCCFVFLLTKFDAQQPAIYHGFELACAVRLLNVYYILMPIVPWILTSVQRKINARMGMAYDSVRGFIVGEEDATKHLQRLVHDPQTTEKLLQRCKLQRLKALEELANLQVQLPGAAVTVKTSHAAQSVLNTVQDMLEDLLNSGIINDNEYHLLTMNVEKAMFKAHNTPPRIETLEFKDQLKEYSWTRGNIEIINDIVTHSVLKSLEKGEVVFSQGDPASGIYILASGMLRVERSLGAKQTQVLQYIFPSKYLGEISALTGECHSASLVSEVPSKVFHLNLEKVTKILEKFPDLRKEFISTYCLYKAGDALEEHPNFTNWNDAKLHAHLVHGEIIYLKEGSPAYNKKFASEMLVLVRGKVFVPILDQSFEATDNLPVILPDDASTVTYSAPLATQDIPVCWIYAIPPPNVVFSDVLPIFKTEAFTAKQTAERPDSREDFSAFSAPTVIDCDEPVFGLNTLQNGNLKNETTSFEVPNGDDSFELKGLHNSGARKGLRRVSGPSVRRRGSLIDRL